MNEPGPKTSIQPSTNSNSKTNQELPHDQLTVPVEVTETTKGSLGVTDETTEAPQDQIKATEDAIEASQDQSEATQEATHAAKKQPVKIFPKLHDGRDFKDCKSKYTILARFWIYIELSYLIVLLFVFLSVVALCGLSYLPAEDFPLISDRPLGSNSQVLFWLAVGSAGALGGTIMALKWHYHCVAKQLWHADRRVWRITTPLLSGVVALFVIMLVASGFLPIFSAEQVSNPMGGASIGFLIGLFADNILAALQNFAQRAFGTLRDAKPNGKTNDE